MEDQVTILTMYCVEENENNYFKMIHEFVKCFLPTNAKITVKLNLFYQ